MTNKPKRKGKPARIWERVGEWKGLFTLWKLGPDYLAELQPELRRIERRLERGFDKEPESADWRNAAAERLEEVLVRVATGARNQDSPDYADRLSLWIESFAAGVYSELVKSIGPMIDKLLRGSVEEAMESAHRCRIIFDAAIEGLVQDRLPSKREKGRTAEGRTPVVRSGDVEPGVVLNARLLPDEPKGRSAMAMLAKMDKALVAIETARELCEEERRLPRKAEVRARMESWGLKYSAKSKGGRYTLWPRIWERAGLTGLPD
jgi:hypothetical protein